VAYPTWSRKCPLRSRQTDTIGHSPTCTNVLGSLAGDDLLSVIALLKLPLRENAGLDATGVGLGSVTCGLNDGLKYGLLRAVSEPSFDENERLWSLSRSPSEELRDTAETISHRSAPTYTG
jgi:hypothetical protein